MAYDLLTGENRFSPNTIMNRKHGSRNAAKILVEKGYKVYNLDKGVTDWQELGKEISR